MLLADLLETNAIYEPIDDNPLLEKFYEDRGKYGFVFQIDMISRRFELIQQALIQNNSVLDRSILEDSIFLDQLFLEGHVNKYEHEAYHKLLKRMLKELDGLPKKRPDLLVYIDIPFRHEIERINKRAREFEKVEKGTDLYRYFQLHSQMYDEWRYNFTECPIIDIDATKYDFVNNIEDQNKVLEDIVIKMIEIKALTFDEGILAFCKLYDKKPKEIAMDVYNKIQLVSGGKLEYHNIAAIWDNKIENYIDLKNKIQKEKGEN